MEARDDFEIGQIDTVCIADQCENQARQKHIV